MPTLFVPHGAGPCFFMEWSPADAWTAMADFLRGIAATLPRTPEAIVLISGHWLKPEFQVTGARQPDLIYDYYGFPAHTYALRYPAPGEPALAARLASLLSDAALSCAIDHERGFDHGVFIPLKLMFPQAQIPVVGVWGAMEPKTNVSPTNAFRCLLPRRPSRQNSCACRPPG